MPRGKNKIDTKKEEAARKQTQAAFLHNLAVSCNVSASCRLAKVSRGAVYQWRSEDAEFAKAWDDALTEAIELLEAEAWQRARKQSDTLMIFLLKAHKPEKYRETIRAEHSGLQGKPIQHTHTVLHDLSDDELDAIIGDG